MSMLETKPDTETLNLVFEEVKAKRKQQEERNKDLDSKAYAILAASSVIAISSSFRLSARSLEWYSIALLFMVFVCYLGTLWMLRKAITPREFNFPPKVKSLYPKYLDASPDEVKLAIITSVVDAYDQNEQELRGKADIAGKAITLLVVESILLTLGLALS